MLVHRIRFQFQTKPGINIDNPEQLSPEHFPLAPLFPQPHILSLQALTSFIMDRIFFKTETFDPITNVPIYIFDTSYLPSTDQIDYDKFIPTLMQFVPTKPYTLIMFSCGLNKISWIWGIKFLKTFLAETNNLNNLIKIITVHDSWFVKSITQILANYNLTLKTLQFKFNDEDDPSHVSFKNLINCSTLSELSNYVDITKLKISLNIYKHNIQLEPQLNLSMRITPLIHAYTKINRTTDVIFYHHFYQIFNIIDLYADKVDLIFHKPGNKINTDILFQCINRNQLIWINDWDLYCISTVFKKVLMELPRPLIVLDCIKLPIKDDLKYTQNTFKDMVRHHKNDQDRSNYDHLLIQLCNLCHKILQAPTKHTSLSLSKCLSHCLSHELISSQSKDTILVVNRFFKNVLDHWDKMMGIYANYSTIDETINGMSHDDSYDMSYDLTLEDDDNYRVAFNTSNILKLNDYDEAKNTDENILNLTLESIDKSVSTIDDSAYIETSSLSIGENSNLAPTTSVTSKPPSRVSILTTSQTPSTSEFSNDSSNSSNSSISPVTFASSSSSVTAAKKKLSDVSNLALQYPPQKYNFTSEHSKAHSRTKSLPPNLPPSTPVKKPVIRGRKVGELAKLFEERTLVLELLKGM